MAFPLSRRRRISRRMRARAKNPKIRACMQRLRRPEVRDRIFKRYPYSKARRIYAKALGKCWKL